MHTFQLASEDYGVQNDGVYADAATKIEPLLPSAGAAFKNPFLSGAAAQGSGIAFERSEEHTSELQSQSNLVCRLLLEKKKKKNIMRSVTAQGGATSKQTAHT